MSPLGKKSENKKKNNNQVGKSPKPTANIKPEPISGSESGTAMESKPESPEDTILEFRNVSMDYEVREGLVKSVDQVSFSLERGKITALIGESGSGKSTLTGAVLRIIAPNGRIHPDSEILFENKNILTMNDRDIRNFRWRKASMVFQAAQNALNPTLTIKEQLTDSIGDHGENPHSPHYKERLEQLLSMVRLNPQRVLNAYPHQLSGGMRQRVIIAMSLILEPEFIILDEPTTALDIITQSYIFDILKEIHNKTKLTMLFITHDMSAVAKLSDIVGVMYAGKICEMAKSEELFENPLHPYTAGLLNSIPSIEGDLIKRKPIPGQPPDLINKPTGCVFHPRCQYGENPLCREKDPLFMDIGRKHLIACHQNITNINT